MNHSQLREIKSNPENIADRPESNLTYAPDDGIFTKIESNDDQQAQIHRRVYARHSIKSISGRKTSSKQTLDSEVRMNSYLAMFHDVCCYVKREIFSSGDFFFRSFTRELIFL